MKNKKGFTLIELMISLVIILIAMLGLYKVVALSVESNVKNVFRDEAIKLAGRLMNDIKSLNYDLIPTNGITVYEWKPDELHALLGLEELKEPYDPAPYRAVKIRTRNAEKVYKVVVETTQAGSSVKHVRVTVGWDVKRENREKALNQKKEFEYSTASMVVKS